MPAIASPSIHVSPDIDVKQVIAFGNAEFIHGSTSETHQTILQGLNRWMKYDDGEQYFLDVEAFQGTEEAWDKAPVIFAQDHPEDFDLVDTDLEAALAQLKDYKGRPGRVCGSLNDSEVLIPGQPRLSSKVTFDDPEIQGLYEKGKLSVSTGFTCTPGDDGHLDGKVRPNHVLIFVVDDNSQPRDKAAMLLNLEKEDQMDAKHIGKVISEKNRSRFKQAIDLLTSLFTEMAPEDQAANKDPSVPSNPKGYKIGPDAGSCKVTEGDFGEMEFSEIRTRFAFDDGSRNITGLKLPHHDPKTGDLRPNCVRAALQAVGGARTGSPMDLQGKEEAVKSHLEAHMKEIKKETSAEHATVGEILAGGPASEESFEDTIAKIRTTLAKSVGLVWPDGSQRAPWIVMTFPDTVVWQHPATERYFSTPYEKADGGEIALGQPTEVEQTWVKVKAAMVIPNMTIEELGAIAKRSDRMVENKPETPASADGTAGAELTNKDTEIKKLSDENAELRNTLAKNEQDRKDADWAILKNKIPPGWIDTPEHEAEIRAMAEKDPLKFGVKLADHRLNPDTEEQGHQHAQNPANPAVRRGIGVINKEGKWED